MAKMEERNEALRTATREKILSAATVLFARKGLAGTGVQEIADKAGSSVGLLYRHFKTKEDIFGTLIEKAMADMKAFSTIAEGDIPPVDLIKITAVELVNKINKDDEYLQFQKLLSRAMDDIPDALPHMVEPLMEYTRNLHDKLTRLIERGQKNGAFRQGSAEGMANLFLATIQGLCAWKLYNKDGDAQPTPQMLTAFLLKEEHNFYD